MVCICTVHQVKARFTFPAFIEISSECGYIRMCTTNISAHLCGIKVGRLDRMCTQKQVHACTNKLSITNTHTYTEKYESRS